MREFRIEAVRSPTLTESEARQRLAAVYRSILEAGRRARAMEGELPKKVKQDGDAD